MKTRHVVLPGLSSSMSLHCNRTCTSSRTASHLCSALNSPWNSSDKIPVVNLIGLHIYKLTGGYHTENREHNVCHCNFRNLLMRNSISDMTVKSNGYVTPSPFSYHSYGSHRLCASLQINEDAMLNFLNQKLPSSVAPKRCLFLFLFLRQWLQLFRFLPLDGSHVTSKILRASSALNMIESRRWCSN